MLIPRNNLIKCLVLILFGIIQVKAGNSTATSGHDLDRVRNPDLYQEEPLSVRVKRRSSMFDRGEIGYEDTGAPGWVTPIPMPELGDFGASRFDEILFNPEGRDNVINHRKSNHQEQNEALFSIFIVLAILILTIIISLRQNVTLNEVKKDKQ